MNAIEKYEYWLEAAIYDLESARVMMDGGRYMYNPIDFLRKEMDIDVIE